MKRWFNVSEVPWRVRTDKTERPSVGKSTLALFVSDRADTEGMLFSLPGSDGPVGFALIEAEQPTDVSNYEQLCFDFSAKPSGAHFQVLLKDDQWNQPQGTLTFQHDFVVASPEKQTRCFSLTAFKATIRGKPFPAFTLNRRAVRTFAVQIARSTQQSPLLEKSPLTFSFSIAGDIELR